MKARARYTMAAVLVFLTLVVVGAGGVAVYANRLTKHTPTQETLIYGQSELYPRQPGSAARGGARSGEWQPHRRGRRTRRAQIGGRPAGADALRGHHG